MKSYRQLPIHLYQVQKASSATRFARALASCAAANSLMKDGYSFHTSFADLDREYRSMHDTYSRIFTRLGLKFRAVAADTGSISGTGSPEFHVLADSGEDAIVLPDSDYAANVELAEALPPRLCKTAAAQ